MQARRLDVLLCADADPTAGLGHLRRSYGLAGELRRSQVRSAIFLRKSGPGADWLAACGESPQLLDPDTQDASGVARAAARHGARVVVLDFPTPIGRRYVTRLREGGCAVVVMENQGSGRLVADLWIGAAFNPALSWRHAAGEHVASPAYAVLGEAFRPVAKRRSGAVRVLVTMGGNDPDGLTDAVPAALNRIEDPIQPVLIVGPGYRRHPQLRDTLMRTTHPWEVHYAPREIAPLVATADVAVAALGMSAYELAAAGVPSVLVPRRRGDRWHADLFAAAGAAVIAERTPEGIADALRPFVIGRALRRRSSLAAEQFVDGRGGERVAELVGRLLSRRRSQALPRRSVSAGASG